MTFEPIRLWTDIEIAILRKLYNKGFSGKEIHQVTGRPIGSIASKAKQLGLTRTSDQTRVNRSKAQMGKVKIKIKGVKVNNFTNSEDETILNMRNHGYTYKQIENALEGRISQTIRYRFEWLTKRIEIKAKARVISERDNRDKLFNNAMDGRFFEDVPGLMAVVYQSKRTTNAYGF